VGVKQHLRRHRLVQLAAAILLGGLFAQFPNFYTQYLQRLGGRAEQAEAQAQRIAEAARAEGLSLEAYVGLFHRSPVSAHRRQGRLLEQELDDAARLGSAYLALRDAPAAARPFVLARHLELRIARRTLGDFGPAIPLTAESLVYALLGVAGVLGVGAGVARWRTARRGLGTPT
jgi:hypothetical protein